jgi:hypothetical protein
MRRTRDPTEAWDELDAATRSRTMLKVHLDALCGVGDCGATLANDAALTVMETGEVTRGRAEVAELLTYLHCSAFVAPPVVSALVTATERVMIEAEFAGKHTGEFAGISPTGRMVRLRYAVAYELTADTITAVRLYFPMDALVRQLRNP